MFGCSQTHTAGYHFTRVIAVTTLFAAESCQAAMSELAAAPAPAATHSLASSAADIETLFASALANGGTTPIPYGFDVPGREVAML